MVAVFTLVSYFFDQMVIRQEDNLRNNQITREGMIIISKTENLLNLQRLDLRVNKLGKRWEVKLKEQSKLPKLSQLRIA